MMRFTAYSLVLALAVSAANAEPLVVKTGEHEDFTRVVVPLPEGADWSFESDLGSHILTIAGHSDGFDLGQAFDIIPRNRLTALLTSGSSLELQLACDCPIQAFEENNGFLVIDISDGPGLDTARENIRQTAPLPVTEYSYGDLLWHQSPANDVDAEQEGSNVAQFENESSGQPDVEALILQRQEDLLKAVGHAASRGLLSLRNPLPADPPPVEMEPEPVEVFDASREVPDPETNSSHIRVTDSGHVPSQEHDDRVSKTGASCPDPSRVQLADWATEESFGIQLARSNRELYDELGRLQKDVVLDRVKLYLFFGFGAEALQTVDLAPEQFHDWPELLDMASILEFGFARNPRLLHRHAACPSGYALWGALALKEMAPDLVVENKAALRALSELPPHLKRVLAPELSARFANRGDLDSAAIAVRATKNVPATPNQALTMAESRVKSLKGAHTEAENDLLEVISANANETPEAIIALVNDRYAAGKDIPADVALLAETYAFELRNADLEAEIYRAYLLSAALSEQYAKAFEAFSTRPEGLQGPRSKEIADAIQSTVTGNASDAAFLQHYFSDFPDISHLLSDEVKTNTAERLLELGFFPQAETVIEGMSRDYKSERFLLTKAEILIHKGSADQALQILNQVDDMEAARLKAMAFLQNGDHARASESFLASNDLEQAATARWLASDWQDQVDEQVPVFGAFSDLAKENVDPIGVDDKMLRNAQSALSASMSARSTLATALEALQFESSEDG